MNEIMTWIISLLFVIALILGLALLMKKFLLGNTSAPNFFGKNTKRRLKIVEILPIDHKSRLLLIRRDDVEHLIMQGQTTENVIETGIKPPLSAQEDTPISQDQFQEDRR